MKEARTHVKNIVFYEGYSSGLNRSWDQPLAILLLYNFGQVVHTRASAIKQYNLAVYNTSRVAVPGEY